MYITSGDELPDSVIFKQFFCFVRMDGVKLFGAVGASIDEDAVSTTGVIFEEAGAIIDVTVDNDPSRVRVGMFFHFGDGEHF